MYYNQRKIKRQVNHITKKLMRNGFFQDCNYHPCVITRINKCYQDLYGSFVDGISLITGNSTSCAITHCNAYPITRNLAIEQAEFWRKHGSRTYYRKYVNYNDEMMRDAEELNKTWQFLDRDIVASKSAAQIANEHWEIRL